VLAADDSSALLPTIVSRCARVRLGPVAADVVSAMLVDAGVADAARGTALARLASGRPGAALALARQPDAVLAQSRIARLLIDLLGADRRRRMSSQNDLIEDGAVLAAAASGAARASDDEPPMQPATRRRSVKSERGPRRASPAERRAAVAQVLTVWRDVARDLCVAARGGRRELRQHDLLEELTAGGADVEAPEIAAFLARLEAISRAVEAYANPELALDALLLEWPQPRRRAAA
jgi:hypothetical protein